MNFLEGYHLDKPAYFLMETGELQDLEIRCSDTEKRVQIQEVCVQFDWMENSYWYENCNIEIKKAGVDIKLPILNFKLNQLEISEGSHNFKPFVKYQIYENGKWEKKEYKSKKGGFIEIKKAPNRNYKVFISHSNDSKDLILLKKFVTALECCGVNGYYAESDVEAGTLLWDKIEREIRVSDAFLILWTKAASKSLDVREEIGIAIGAKKKPLIPVVEKKISVVGSLKAREIEWISFDPSDPHKGLMDALEFIFEKVDEKESKQKSFKESTRGNH